MNWVQPKFTDFVIPPSKKQKTGPVRVKKLKYFDEESEVALINKWKPRKKSDLVIHKKKIEEVERWLEDTKKKNGSSFLLLYGPPGCGKLTTLKILCSESGINLVEWAPQIALTCFNPDSTSNLVYQSEISKFADFVVRATRYSNVLNRNSCRLIIVKDIPNQFIKDSKLFHEFLSKYKDIDDVNLVFIVTDFKINRELFNDDARSKFNIKSIQFNPVTQRNTSAALQKIAKGKFSEYLESISLESAGDLRNAIATLQFLSVKGTLPHKKKQQLPSNSKSECLDLFHGIGRILYAKREDGKFKHCPLTVADSFTSSPDLFVNMLQENYLGTFSTIHEIAKASDVLSDSDLLLKPLQDNASLSSLSLNIAALALMSYNSEPIKKFQHFNRPTRISVHLDEYRSLEKNSKNLIDIISYGRFVPSFSITHRAMFNKLKPLGAGVSNV